MYYVKFRIWVTSELCYSLEYNVDALNVKWKDHLSKETIMKRKREAFRKSFQKVKLVLVNIRFRLDISMPIMVTNPGFGFGAWHRTRPQRSLPITWANASSVDHKIPAFCSPCSEPPLFKISFILSCFHRRPKSHIIMEKHITHKKQNI